MTEKTWGMRVNGQLSYEHFSKTRKAPHDPNWLRAQQISIWYEDGPVLWSNIDKKIVALKGHEALRLTASLFSIPL